MSNPPSRFEKIVYQIDLEKNGLEIGPSISPVLPKREGYNVKILDHASAETLQKKYQALNVDSGNVEEVDYIWSGEPIDKLVGNERFHYIIASHVIEHVPDIISFLVELNTILEDDGIVSLVIPDKRFTFDYYRQLSSTGQVLEAFLRKRIRPSIGMVFDFTAEFAHFQLDQNRLPELGYSLYEAEQHMLSAFEKKAYTDIHQWCFSFASFQLIMNDLLFLDYLPLAIEHVFPVDGLEFYVTLKKKQQGLQQVQERQGLVQMLAAEQAAWYGSGFSGNPADQQQHGNHMRSKTPRKIVAVYIYLHKLLQAVRRRFKQI